MAESEAETPSTPGEFESKYFEFHGVRLPPFCRGKMEEIANFPVRPSDVWIVTYPKSGEPCADPAPAGSAARRRGRCGPRAGRRGADWGWGAEGGGAMLGARQGGVGVVGPGFGGKPGVWRLSPRCPWPGGVLWGWSLVWRQQLPGRQAQARHPSLPPLPMSSWLCDLGQSLNLSVLGFGSAL